MNMPIEQIPYVKPLDHEVERIRTAIERAKARQNARDARHVNAQRRKGES